MAGLPSDVLFAFDDSARMGEGQPVATNDRPGGSDELAGVTEEADDFVLVHPAQKDRAPSARERQEENRRLWGRPAL